MEKLIARGNILSALDRVQRNRGAPGIDGMETKDLREYLVKEGAKLREELLNGSYRPQPVRRVEIPKANGGGMRKLRIPTLRDRLVQQAMLQVLTPIFDPSFSENSFGFRPGKSAQQAVAMARSFANDGYEFVVDIDLEAFFDKVNHDKLMELLSVHPDNGGPMKGATMLSTMQKLGVVPSFSRPSVKDDNPFSEALFKTLNTLLHILLNHFQVRKRPRAGLKHSHLGTTRNTFIRLLALPHLALDTAATTATYFYIERKVTIMRGKISLKDGLAIIRIGRKRVRYT